MWLLLASFRPFSVLFPVGRERIFQHPRLILPALPFQAMAIEPLEEVSYANLPATLFLDADAENFVE